MVVFQNESGDSFYIILEGLAEILIDDKPFTIYEKGNIFGELAVTAKNPLRQATVRAKGPLTLLKIRNKDYEKLNRPSAWKKAPASGASRASFPQNAATKRWGSFGTPT